MKLFDRNELMKTNWAIEHTHPNIDDEELALLYGIAEQLNEFYGKRGHWYDPVAFHFSPFTGFRPVREVGQPMCRMS